jgi:hypothetical protein
MLAAEMLIEHGPDYANESKKYAELIGQYYNKHLEKRDSAAMLRILYPWLSPQKALASTKEALEKAAKGKEEEAKRAIHQAGKIINQLYRRSERFPERLSTSFTDVVRDFLAARIYGLSLKMCLTGY